MAGAQTTNNNYLEAVTATVTETVMMKATTVDAKTIFPSLNSQNYIEFQDNIKVMATF